MDSHCPPLKVAMIAPYPASALLPLAELRPRYHTEHPAPWVRALATALARSGQVNVRVLVDSRAVTRRHEVRADEVTYVFVPKREPIRTDPLHGYIPGAIRIARELRADPPDLVIGFGVEGGCARLAIRQPYPVIVFIQGMVEETAPYRDIHPLRLKAYLRDERKVLFDADAFIAETNFARRWIARHNPKARVAVIPHAMDTVYLTNRPAYDRPLALCVGSLNEIKDPLTVLRAFAQVPVKDARIVFAGSGPLLGPLKEEAERLRIRDRVDFVGFIPRDRLLHLMASARLVVLGSRMDTSPNALTEAHAAALPVVATNAGGIPEMIEDGQDGYIVPVGDAAAMAERMARLLNDPEQARSMGEAGREKVRVLNDPDRIAADHIEFYRAVIRARAAQMIRNRRWLDQQKKNRIIRALAGALPTPLLLGRSYRVWIAVARQESRYTREQIEQWQLERFRQLVRYAYEHTAGYRELYRKAGLKPEDIRTYADIQHVPCVTKEMIRDHLDEFSARIEGRLYATTGGSTGIPLGFYYYRGLEGIEWAFMHASWEWAGWKNGMRSAVLRGGFIGSRDKIAEYDPLRKHLLLSSYFLTADSLPRYLEAIARHKIRVIQAYPSSLNLFCEFLRETGARPPPFELILLGSENIYDWQYENFRKMFPAARIFAWYGQAEQVTLAPWCEHTRHYHSRPLYGMTEILDPSGRPVPDGGEGEIVGTNFHNLVTPFIRYRTMDHAIRKGIGCPACKRPFLVMEKILGRAHEFIVSGTGRLISMTAINMHDDIFDGIRQFRFRQERPGEVVFQYIPAGPLGAERLSRIRNGLEAKLGDDVRLELKQVDEIPRSPSGKFHFLDQKLPIAYHHAP